MNKGLLVIGLDKKERQFGQEVASQVSDLENLIIYQVINAVPYSMNEITDAGL